MRRSGRPERDEDPRACSRAALSLLARREHSRRELEQKLRRRFPAEAVSETLDDLERSGALSSERFAEAFVRMRAAKGQGPVRIRTELLGRGLSEDGVAAALAACACDWAALAAAARRKRFGPGAPASFGERARQARFLEYRGFAAEQIHAALELAEDCD